jgi:hypothetical protein
MWMEGAPFTADTSRDEDDAGTRNQPENIPGSGFAVILSGKI